MTIIFCVSIFAQQTKSLLCIVLILIKTDRPERIFVGICCQCDPNEEEIVLPKCLVNEIPNIANNVRVIYSRSFQATGPCWARHVAQQLWKDEEYFLQIDSHMRYCLLFIKIKLKKKISCLQGIMSDTSFFFSFQHFVFDILCMFSFL